ncbi:hypothetical protein Tco_0168698 [Tanacetum coccineum]
MGFPATHPHDGTSKTQPLLEGINTNPKDSERLKPLTDRISFTPLVTALSWTYAEYQVDKTQSTRFKVSVPDQNKSKTSSKVNDDDVFEAGDEMDEDIQQAEVNDDHRAQTDTTMNHIDKINNVRVKERYSPLKSLNRVSKTLEADSTLKASMIKMAETNTTTSGNISKLIELLRNEKIPEIVT